MAFALVWKITVFLMVLRNFMSSEGTSTSKTNDPEVCYTQACQESARHLLEAMDDTVDPCDNFYQYACGGWIDKHTIPKDRKSYSITDALNDEIYSVAAGLLENATREDNPKAVIDAALLFQGCIDVEARERQGLNPLKNALNSLGGWPMMDPQWSSTGYQWSKQVATMIRTLGIQAIISVEVTSESTENSRYTIEIKEPEFGIEKEHLLNWTSSERTIEIVAAYRNYIISAGKLLNPSTDEVSLGNYTEEILQFESDLAAEPEPLPPEPRMREPWYKEMMNFIEHIMTGARPSKGPLSLKTVSDVQKIIEEEDFNWIDFLNDVFQDSLSVRNRTEIMTHSLSYLRHAIRLIDETDPRIVANYIGWIMLKNIGRHTTKDFRDIAFRFQKVVEEVDASSLEKYCVIETAGIMDFAVGRLYSDKSISEEEMQEIEQLVEDIRSAFEVNFNHNSWMDPKTKRNALKKLRNMANLIGIPSWIKVDSELNDYYRMGHELEKEKYFESLMRVKGAVQATKFKKWNQKIHRTTEWMSINFLDVDAMYSSDRNAMYFPVAMFNPPIYRRGTVPALNYAGVGSYVAHEITHGFDNQGRSFDKEGKTVNWWSREMEMKFREKADCLMEQYGEIVEPMTNTSLRSRATLGDDIADNGAVRNAFMAYRMKVLQAEENEVVRRNIRLPGLSASPEQLYFLALANLECSRQTEKSMKWFIENDQHSPGIYRVLLPLRNSRAFSEAFNCPVGSPMNPEEKCQLW